MIETAGEARVEAGDISEDDVAQTRPDYQSSADDNVIIQGIQGSDTSFGWVGFAFAEEAPTPSRRSSSVDGADGDCVEPTTETIADGSYPISPAAVHLRERRARPTSNPTLADYVDFYLSDDGIAAVGEVGYVELPEDQLDETRTTWDDRTTGTTES